MVMASSKVETPVQAQVQATHKAVMPRIFITVFAVTLVAAALRMYRLGDWSFWVDEMFTLLDISGNSKLGRYHGMTYPLSYILIEFSINRFGESEWSARLVPALVGIATPAMVYLLARKLFGELPSIIGASIIAISPWHLYWSQMARFYTMTLFFSAFMLVLYRGMEENRKGYVVSAGILMALAAASHYSALLILGAIAVYVGLIFLLRWQKPAGINFINAIIFLSPLIIGGLFVGKKALSLLSNYFAGYPTGTHIANPIKAAGYVVFSIGYRLEFVIAALMAIGVVIGLAQRSRGALILSSVVAVPALFLVIAGIMSHAENRYAFVILPAAVLLAGNALTAVIQIVKEKNRLLAYSIPVIIALPLLQHDAVYFSPVSNGERWNYKAAANYLRTHAKSGDKVYSSMWMPLSYYLDDTSLVVQDLDVGKDTADLPDSRAWLVMEDATRGESVSKLLADWLDRKCSLKSHFSASSPVADYGLSVYLYQRSKD